MIEQKANDKINSDPQIAADLRKLAYKIFHKWVKAEFYRQWWQPSTRTNGILSKTRSWARVYLLGNGRRQCADTARLAAVNIGRGVGDASPFRPCRGNP